MATNGDNATYPKVGRKVWLALRARFLKSVPSVVTPTYISSVMPMEAASARANVMNPLREMGLLDKDFKPTPLAQRWRHDDEYKAVCHEIRAAKYPAELLDAYPDGEPSQKEQIKKWFASKGGVGETASRMMADTYILLSQGDPTAAEATAKPTAPKASTTATGKTSKKVPASRSPKTADAAPPPAQDEMPPPPSIHGARRLPAVHIDVQVHISPDTSAEQIDRIFESMSKHLGSYIK